MSFGRQTHEIELRAKDGASNTFRLIGREGQQAMQQIDTAAKKTTRSMDQVKTAGRDLAIGVGALTGVFALAARSQVEAQRQSALLTRQYGDQADVLRELADEIQRTTQFSNDQATSAINTFATLQRNYGLTTDQIVELTRVTVDLAAATGFTLEDAAMRVQAAIRGEAEAAEVLGLTLNQQAIDRNNLTLTMSNQEAGQFRLNALLEQSAFAEGAAAERAATHAGQVRQLANAVQDVAQDFAAWSGVTGEVVAVASDFTLQIALMGGGLVKLGSGIRTLAGAAGIGGLAAALGPAGLVAAAALAGGAFLLLRDDTDEAAESLRVVDRVAQDLIDTWNDLAAAGTETALLHDTLGTQVSLLGAAMTDQTRRVPELRAELEQARDELTQLASADAILRAGVGATTEELDRSAGAVATQTARVSELEDALAHAEGSAGLFADAELALTQILREQGPGAEKAIDAVLDLAASWDDGLISNEQFAKGIIEQADALGEYNREAIASTRATQDLTVAVVEADGGFDQWGRRIVNVDNRLSAMNHEIRKVSGELPEYQRRTEAVTEVSAAAAIAIDDQRAALVALAPQLNSADAFSRNLAAGILMVNDAQNIFKATQDGLIASQSVYSQQQSEYGQQLNALQAAEDLLNQRRADGIALTAEQVDFLTRVDAAQRRLTGGVEDATLAEGNLALQYAENMAIGDQLNENLKGQQTVTGDLIELVKLLILSLDGIPEDVKSEVRLLGAEDAVVDAAELNRQLSLLDGRVVTGRVTIHQAVLGPSLPTGFPSFVGGLPGFQHGGLLDSAQHGRVPTPPVLVGEAGPELLSGRLVVPSSATRAGLRDGGGGDHFANYGTLNVIANDPRGFLDQWRRQAVTGARP